MQFLKEAGYEVDDRGTHSEESVDYPDIAVEVAQAIANGDADRGVLVCGTGIGQSIVANKVAGVRAALVHDVTVARLAREHNNANVMCLGARVTGPEVAKEALTTFLGTEWDGSGRHLRRVEKIVQIDQERPEQERDT